jgi:hypothetical protein
VLGRRVASVRSDLSSDARGRRAWVAGRGTVRGARKGRRRPAGRGGRDRSRDGRGIAPESPPEPRWSKRQRSCADRRGFGVMLAAAVATGRTATQPSKAPSASAERPICPPLPLARYLSRAGSVPNVAGVVVRDGILAAAAFLAVWKFSVAVLPASASSPTHCGCAAFTRAGRQCVDRGDSTRVERPGPTARQDGCRIASSSLSWRRTLPQTWSQSSNTLGSLIE